MAATAGRTTLNGEGSCNIRTGTACCLRARCRRSMTYDPAFAYELAVIIQDG
jgi:pyruvate dehydrogenase E1 component